VPSAQAPVHEVVLTGDDADLTTLPVHLQHRLCRVSGQKQRFLGEG
jgi:hypothetical protein